MKPVRNLDESTLRRITQAVESIRYGTIQIVIQDSRVIQIEKTEKIRLDRADQTAGGTLIKLPLTDQITGGMRQLEKDER